MKFPRSGRSASGLGAQKLLSTSARGRKGWAASWEQLDHLFAQNRAWADAIRARDPEFFPKLSRQQSPEYLWIGCSDSRVPANEIVSLLPGELFVHRNIANVVVHTDLNCLSVMQFAVDVLKVKHIIVCGHYGCSGVRAALRGDRIGLADNWLRHVQDVSEKHQSCVHAVHGRRAADESAVRIQRDRAGGQCLPDLDRARRLGARPALTVHSWIYGLQDGLIRNLGMSISSEKDIEPQYRAAQAAIEKGGR